MALGVAILAGFLALKICMIKKHLFDIDSSDLRFNGKQTVTLNWGSVSDKGVFPTTTQHKALRATLEHLVGKNRKSWAKK